MAGNLFQECQDTWKCCYDPRAQIQCFLPLGDPNRSENSSSGMTNAGAVFLTLFMFSLPPVAFFLYAKFSPASSGGFTNPMA